MRVAEIEKRMKKSIAELQELASHLGEMASTVRNPRSGYREAVAGEPDDEEKDDG
jgi:hypothetical protein